MSRTARLVGTGLLLTLLTGLVPQSELPRANLQAVEPQERGVPASIAAVVERALATGDPLVELDMVTASPAQTAHLKQKIAALGGQVVLEEKTYVQAKLPPAAAQALSTAKEVVSVGSNAALNVEAFPTATLNQDLSESVASGLLEPSLSALEVPQFRGATQAQGRGIKVAVVDSGIDAGHPALQRSPAGDPKIIDWQDFTGEGDVKTPYAAAWGVPFSVPGDNATYALPVKPAASAVARFGFWEEFRVEGAINQDLNRNGSRFDRIAVLLVDTRTTGVYDTVYVDTNNDRDFRNEQPLRIYRESFLVGRLGERGNQSLSFVAAQIDPAGNSVTFGFDGLGHGTQVAGVLGGFRPGGFAGVAPGVQILALKALRSDSSGTWFSISRAIRYAAENGASIINVSIGGLAAVSQFDRTSSERLNQIAREYGVVIVVAADNTGPGLSSGVSIGSSSEVLTVGAYYSPAMWKRDFGYVVPREGVLAISGMGPRSDGSYVPSVVAPGGSPTTSPLWLHNSGYTTAVGTSIATPHVSGSAALLMEAARSAGRISDRLSIKRSLEVGARKIPGLGSTEQGHGLLQLVHSFDFLKVLDFLPTVSIRSRDGNENGFLARSFLPGSTEFTLTNLDREAGRVSLLSSEPWVESDYKTLTLPPGLARRLPLRITPPTEPGVHSAFVVVHHQGKNGPVSTLPVTYVRPMEFSPAQGNTISLADELEVARYRRHFFDIKPGTANLNLSVRVRSKPTGEALGTIQVHVFRPDGKVVHRSLQLGANGQSASTLFQTEHPVAGTWEVVVTALPDRAGTHLAAAYTLEAEVQPGPVPGAPIQLTQSAGTRATHAIRLTNPFPTFVGGIEAVGVVATDASVPWRVVRHGIPVEDFTLRESVSYMRLEVSNPVPANVDLDLYLLREDSNAPGGFGVVKQALTLNVSREVIEVVNLPPGRYLVNVLPNGNVPFDLEYQYRRLVAAGGASVRFSDPPRRRDKGDSWTATLTIDAPERPGRYFGQIILRDTEKNATLGWYPFEVSVGQPSLDVQTFSPQLVKGRPSNVLLQLRDSSTRRPVNGTVTVNGQRFTSHNGQVNVPVMAMGTTHTLRVSADIPGFSFLQREILLPVADSWSAHPVGLDPGEGNPLWRKKVQSQAP